MSASDRFAPKEAFKLDPPKDTPISTAELAKADGIHSNKLYVAIKGTVFDVTRNGASYGPGKGYHIFTGKDASRALAKSSLRPTDAIARWEDLTDKEKKVLDDWYYFFSLRYNIVGKVSNE